MDLTPLLPGGENGGAKLMTLELIRALAGLLSQTTFILLTARSSHAELDRLEGEYPNIQRICVLDNQRVMATTISAATLLRQLGADLLFCPFTAPFYADPRIPTVSVIYDLQYRAYPQFFTPEELIQRADSFKTAHQKANYLVTISEYVRQTVIKAADMPAERVIAVPIGLFDTTQQKCDASTKIDVLEKYDLQHNEYLLYPANFWAHKNHAILLTAFGLYRQEHPSSRLKLVCTGSPGAGADAFCEATRRMGLASWVIYAGFVSSAEYECLLESAARFSWRRAAEETLESSRSVAL